MLPFDKASDLIKSSPDAAARLTLSDGSVRFLGGWQDLQTPDLVPAQLSLPASNAEKWHEGWQALATFTAPRRQLERDPDFRSPYLAMWITDKKGNPVRTLLLIGTRKDWHKDNFVWWSSNRPRAEKFVSARSMSTSGAGVYNVFWDGVDDNGDPVEPGEYVLHVETSREKGLHTLRSLPLDFSQPEYFEAELETSEESGGLKVMFDHY